MGKSVKVPANAGPREMKLAGKVPPSYKPYPQRKSKAKSKRGY